MEKSVLAVCSSGGHLLQLYTLINTLGLPNTVNWVSFKKSDAKSLLKGEKVYWAHHPTNRNFINLFKNIFLAVKILRVERPSYIISTGAGVAIPFCCLGKLFQCEVIYVESFARKYDLSLTGKVIYFFVDHLFVQTQTIADKYKKAEYFGTIY